MDDIFSSLDIFVKLEMSEKILTRGNAFQDLLKNYEKTERPPQDKGDAWSGCQISYGSYVALMILDIMTL